MTHVEDLKETLREKWKSQPMRSSYNKWHDIDTVAESGVSKVNLYFLFDL